MAFTADGAILDSEKRDEIEKKEAGFSLKYYKVVGVIFDTYIVLQKGESMYLMDQHAAHERVLFERYKKEAGFSLKYYKVVGVIFDTYIVLQKGESMYLMDQHAAHERVLFERYMNALLI